MLTWFANWKVIILSCIVSFVLGLSLGYWTKAKFVKADAYEQLSDAQTETASEVQKSLQTSLTVETKADAQSERVSVIRNKARKHFKETPNEARLDRKTDCPSGPAVLDAGTVFLLNTARSRTGIGAPEFGDEEGRAASPVSLSDLIDNDLEVVGKYWELAERHDALVDWVEAEVKKQAER